jgi:hypothetical protein
MPSATLLPSGSMRGPASLTHHTSFQLLDGTPLNSSLAGVGGSLGYALGADGMARAPTAMPSGVVGVGQAEARADGGSSRGEYKAMIWS